MNFSTPHTTSYLSRTGLAAFFGFVIMLSPAAVSQEAPDMDGLHESCLDQIAQDPDEGFENALIWKGDGGGRRARHCVAIALFALGHKDEAAHRLEEMAAEVFNGTLSMRADLYAEAADFWLAFGDAQAAYRAASSGLDVSDSHLDLRITRALSYAKMDRWDFAETDLTSAIAFHPNSAKAYRLRADTRRRLGKLEEALSDIETAMRHDPDSVETAVVRGEIREDIRLKALKN